MVSHHLTEETEAQSLGDSCTSHSEYMTEVEHWPSFLCSLTCSLFRMTFRRVCRKAMVRKLGHWPGQRGEQEIQSGGCWSHLTSCPFRTRGEGWQDPWDAVRSVVLGIIQDSAWELTHLTGGVGESWGTHHTCRHSTRISAALLESWKHAVLPPPAPSPRFWPQVSWRHYLAARIAFNSTANRPPSWRARRPKPEPQLTWATGSI